MMNKENFIGPVNVGNPNEFTIKELADMVIELTGSRSKIVYKKLPGDDPVRRKPDISLARKELGWEPAVPLKQGLLSTISYFEKILQNNTPLS